MPWDHTRYPPNWLELRAAVQERAGDACEGSPAYPDCRAKNHQSHPVTGSMVICTTAHLWEDDHRTQDITRLRFWCNRCHLTYDHPQHCQKAAETRARKKGQLALALEAP